MSCYSSLLVMFVAGFTMLAAAPSFADEFSTSSSRQTKNSQQTLLPKQTVTVPDRQQKSKSSGSSGGVDAPDLDTQHFEEVMEEMRRRIPVHSPEWTDHNNATSSSKRNLSLDREPGKVRFGDGISGRRPPTGSSETPAYRKGSGKSNQIRRRERSLDPVKLKAPSVDVFPGKRLLERDADDLKVEDSGNQE